MKLRRLLLVAGLIGIGVLVLVHLGDLSKFWDALQDLQWYVIPLVIIVQLASYYFNARYYQAIAAEKRQLDVALSLSPTTPGQRS